MKAYGLPRRSDLEWPDKADILEYALPSKYGKSKSKRKKAMRRIWKKKERAKVRNEMLP